MKVKVKRIHILYAVCMFQTHFLKVGNEFSRRVFQKVLPLCLVSIQERVMMACVQYMYAMHIIENSSLQVDHDFVLLQTSVITKKLKIKVKWLNSIWINFCCFV